MTAQRAIPFGDHSDGTVRGAHGVRSPRIAIKTRGLIVFISASDIAAVEAQGNYVRLRCHANSYVLRERISRMAERLRFFGFVRIHRSVLVNAAFVKAIQPCSTGEYSIRLENGKEYTATRKYKKNLTSLAESWIGTDGFIPG